MTTSDRERLQRSANRLKNVGIVLGMSRWREVDRSMTEAIQLSIDDINAVLATPSDSLVADLADAGQVDAELRERSRKVLLDWTRYETCRADV